MSSQGDRGGGGGRGGLSLSPLSLEEAVAALLKVEPDLPRKRPQKSSEKVVDDKPKRGK